MMYIHGWMVGWLADQVPMPVPRNEDAVLPGENQPILVTKLRNKQRLKCSLVATKGIGKIHSKWSPVATAAYKVPPAAATAAGCVDAAACLTAYPTAYLWRAPL
eukprot:GHVU01167333.1.p2 GENE.GHVU01167333.1~~GHVU01167333.1.p2  ORF type:complete len:104 (-),score=22.84 GHVU01167333.1:421-732(-)